jgi:hypothetical protein
VAYSECVHFLYTVSCSLAVSVCECLKIFDLLKFFLTFENFLKFEEIFDSQYLLIGIQTLAKNIDKCVFILEFKHNYSQF